MQFIQGTTDLRGECGGISIMVDHLVLLQRLTVYGVPTRGPVQVGCFISNQARL